MAQLLVGAVATEEYAQKLVEVALRPQMPRWETRICFQVSQVWQAVINLLHRLCQIAAVPSHAPFTIMK